MPRGGVCFGTAGRATHRSCSCAAAACHAPPAGPAVAAPPMATPACWACSTCLLGLHAGPAVAAPPGPAGRPPRWDSRPLTYAAATSGLPRTPCSPAGLQGALPTPLSPPPPVPPRRGGPRASQPNLPDGLFQARMLVSERRRARDGRGLLVAHAAQLSKLLWRARGVRSRPPPPGGEQFAGPVGMQRCQGVGGRHPTLPRGAGHLR
jgi:hypothetical protein